MALQSALRQIHYPESDGKPMAEYQRQRAERLAQRLRELGIEVDEA